MATRRNEHRSRRHQYQQVNRLNLGKDCLIIKRWHQLEENGVSEEKVNE